MAKFWVMVAIGFYFTQTVVAFQAPKRHNAQLVVCSWGQLWAVGGTTDWARGVALFSRVLAQVVQRAMLLVSAFQVGFHQRQVLAQNRVVRVPHELA
jgi:hypothetical protein